MTYYHGSPIGNLKELVPSLSEHNKPYIYFSTNPLVALLYAVKPVPKPFSFYPYGFDKDGNLVYSEYFENAFYELYNGKTGYLYEVENINNIKNPTNINSAVVCEVPVKITNATKISNLYEYYLEKEKIGKFTIKKNSGISQKEMDFVLSELKKDIEKYKLFNYPENPMTLFLKKYFPKAFD